MADLWNVYRSDGRTLGPYSASEVREALRDGSIDPFDQVARVGSKLKQSLVEVDEIFLEIDEASPKVDSIYGENSEIANPNRGSNLVATAHATPLKKQSHQTAVSPMRGQRRAEPPSGVGRGQAQRANNAKKHAKRFYLLDRRNRLLGPLSASEIQSLFYRGNIEQDVLVSKDRGDKKVPVQQFIAAYIGAKAKKFRSEKTKLHLEPGHYAYPSSRVMDQLSRSAAAMRIGRGHRHQKIPLLSLGLLAVAAAIAIFIGYKLFLAGNSPPKATPAEVEYPQSIQITAPDANRVIPQSTAVPPPTPVTKIQPLKRQRPEVRSKPKSPPKRSVRRSVRARPVQLRRRVTPRPRTTPRPIIRRTRPVRRAAAPPVRAVPPPAQAKRDPYAKRVGSVITIGAARYNVASVRSCSGMKCTVTFRDSSGVPFAGVFFRARYQDQLTRSRGRATIVGRLDRKGSSYVIYLQGVR